MKIQAICIMNSLELSANLPNRIFDDVHVIVGTCIEAHFAEGAPKITPRFTSTGK